MVTYVKNNFFLVPIVFLLLFVVSSYARYNTEVTKSQIIDICTQKDRDINESVCFEVLDSIPGIATLDYFDLAKYLINYDSRKFSYMMKQFQSLKNSTTDPSSKGSYKMVVPSTSSDLIEMVVPSTSSDLDSKALKSKANLVVSKDGTGNYRTINEAVAAAPVFSKTRFVIYVKKGIYDEIVKIGKPKTNLTIIGDGRDATILTGNLSVKDGTKFFHSATLGNIISLYL
ncbi:PREDICTED: probable pectinesterase/pectinesterase inhibitor 42 [Camelina sativa]|uniref:Pectinesterase n=1 Tax=Camelina sativa TaxID=90675 RepID=A0ABM1QLH9_CAMSA|nr:PREDICTED: probable pectinesterase/pectinesterase inhibitor 42 [Camelina sativa]